MIQRAIDLTQHEDAEQPTFGHTITQHVNIDNAGLRARGKSVASRFKDLATANAMADIAVANPAMAGKITNMVAGNPPGVAAGGVPTPENGIAVKAGDAAEYGAKNVLFEARPYTGDVEPMKSLGYFVQTMYPKDPTNGPPTP
jgi:hypothetical protein